MTINKIYKAHKPMVLVIVVFTIFQFASSSKISGEGSLPVSKGQALAQKPQVVFSNLAETKSTSQTEFFFNKSKKNENDHKKATQRKTPTKKRSTQTKAPTRKRSTGITNSRTRKSNTVVRPSSRTRTESRTQTVAPLYASQSTATSTSTGPRRVISQNYNGAQGGQLNSASLPPTGVPPGSSYNKAGHYCVTLTRWAEIQKDLADYQSLKARSGLRSLAQSNISFLENSHERSERLKKQKQRKERIRQKNSKPSSSNPRERLRGREFGNKRQPCRKRPKKRKELKGEKLSRKKT